MPAPELATAVERILAALAATSVAGQVAATSVAETSVAYPVVLIDGFSGAGKSTLADALVAAWPDAHLVRLENIYPGWDGLEAGSAAVHDDILIPRATGRPASWRRWDWTTGSFAERHRVDSDRPLVIEGAGVLSRANHRLATVGVWVGLDEPTRRDRALARDGAAYAPHWEVWAAQERAFAAREHPRSTADLVVERGG